jgi:hypothetical protein
MRQNAEKLQTDEFEDYPHLTVVGSSHTEKKRSSDRPELLALGWEPRARRLAHLRSASHTAG